MRSKLIPSLAGALALAISASAVAAERGPQDASADEVSYGDAPNAAPWLGTLPSAAQDDSRMQPPEPSPGTEAKSGTTKADADYDFGTMRPSDARP